MSYYILDGSDLRAYWLGMEMQDTENTKPNRLNNGLLRNCTWSTMVQRNSYIGLLQQRTPETNLQSTRQVHGLLRTRPGHTSTGLSQLLANPGANIDHDATHRKQLRGINHRGLPGPERL